MLIVNSTRKGTIELLQCPLSSDNEHQIYFSDLTAQNTYFTALHGQVISNMNLVKFGPDYIDVPADYASAILNNYVRIQNTSINTKWYYYFATKFETINDNATRIYLKIDVWQTWQFDITFSKSFVEREHVITDYFNKMNDLPSEGVLEELITTKYNFTGGYFVFCNADPTVDDTTSSSNIGFSLGNYSIPSYVLFYKEDQKASLSMDLQKIANAGRGDRINACVYVPFIVSPASLNINTTNGYPFCTGATTPTDVMKQTITFDFSGFVAGYKKDLCYPYAYIQVQDLITGQSIILHPEKFSDLLTGQQVNFEIQGTISESPYYKIIPKNYKGQEYSYSDSLVVRCNTSLPVLNNSYAKYLMNNQLANDLRYASAGVGVGASILSGSGMGILSGFENIANTMIQEQQAKKQPNQLSAITDGALERFIFNNGIKVSLFTMDADHQNTAHSFWNMYGYPIKQVKTPVIAIPDGRYHQFTKLQDANISGDIPQTDLQEITSLFNRGITMWNSDYFRQY